jgi:hypothetical protein
MDAIFLNYRLILLTLEKKVVFILFQRKNTSHNIHTALFTNFTILFKIYLYLHNSPTYKSTSLAKQIAN